MKAIRPAPTNARTRHRWQLGVWIPIAVGLVASSLLVLHHFTVLTLPGCQPESSCGRFLASGWNSVFGWPVSFLGLAYFVASAAGLGTNPERVLPVFRVTLRLAVFASLACIVAMCLARSICVYCMAAHAANIVLWINVERSATVSRQNVTPERTAIGLAFFGASFALVSVLLSIAGNEQQRLAKEQLARAEFIAAKTSVSRIEAPASLPAQSEVDEVGPVVREDSSAIADKQPKARQPYRLGSEQAALQLVVFYDYQSERCRQVEREIQELLTQYGQTLAVTARQLPSCSECNAWYDGPEHPNACRAALVAETAGHFKGNDGFWQMHRWLLEKAGDFTDKQLEQALVEFGYTDVGPFLATMQEPQTLSHILADTVEARTHKVASAPAVFLNGRRIAYTQTGHSIASEVKAAADAAIQAAAAPEAPPVPSLVDPNITQEFSEAMQVAALTSTVRIVNASDRSTGSGAIIAVREPFVYVLTAQHIVPNAKSVEVHTYSEQSYPEPSGKYSSAAVIAKSPSSDLALIRFTAGQTLRQHLPIVPSESLPAADDLPVLTAGCAGDNAAPTCHGSRAIGARTLRITAGKPSMHVWELADQSTEGRSGGPLIDQRGYLLGIASGNSAGRGYFIHAREIYRFLEEHGLEGLCPSSSTESLPSQ